MLQADLLQRNEVFRQLAAPLEDGGVSALGEREEMEGTRAIFCGGTTVIQPVPFAGRVI